MKILDGRYVLSGDVEPRAGGMAIVRRARDMQDGERVVAIKFFSEKVLSDPYHRESYARESKILGLLDHRNIVRVVSGGRDSETEAPYLVLEWLDETFADHVKRRPVRDWDDYYARIGKPVLEALSYAFSQNVVHRDLNPKNVMFTEDGQLKLTDFGIAKLLTYITPGMTLQGFGTVPYVPPEGESSLHTLARDVFSFGVLTLSCFSSTPLRNHEDVERAFEQLALPPEVKPVLERALACAPEDRFSNVVQLKNALDQIETVRRGTAASAPKRRIYVFVTQNVRDRLVMSFGVSRADPARFVIDDLNTFCGIKHEGNAADGSMKVSLFAAQNLYEGYVDQDSGAYVALAGVKSPSQHLLEQRRETAWPADVEFVLQAGRMSPNDGKENLLWLQEELTSYHRELAQREQAQGAEKLFRQWRTVLQFKGEVEAKRETPIPYTACEWQGNRLMLRAEFAVDQSLIGQPRMIKVGNDVVAGEVEQVKDENISLWVDDADAGRLHVPERGKLLFDTRASQSALSRQSKALDLVRFGRAARPELRMLLADPKSATVPGELPDVVFFDGEIDESKREAVRRAIAADSFLVVEGPPGTGKTRFITELVRQVIARDATARILIASQTHVALDNALERLKAAGNAPKMVRIGKSDDSRVADKVKDLLLDNRVNAWLAEVRSKSQIFLARMAKDLGVDANEIEFGMAIAQLRAALESEEAAHQRVASLQGTMALLTQEESTHAQSGIDSAFDERSEEIISTAESTKQAETEMKRATDAVRLARRQLKSTSPAGAELANDSLAELREWEDAYLKKDDNTKVMHRLHSLTSEWYLRFGRSSDFQAALIADSSVIAGTCVGVAGIRAMGEMKFDLCIVDEASKATVTETLVPLCRSRKWILVGDRKQLPPFVEDALENESLIKDFGITRDLLQTTLLDLLADGLPRQCVVPLLHQHRMIKPIGDLVSRCFYDGTLINEKAGDPSLFAPNYGRPVVWISTSGLPDRQEQYEKVSGGFRNECEVSLIRQLLKRLDFVAKLKQQRYEVAILTGYALQNVQFRRSLRANLEELKQLTVSWNTVDAYQGREADIAIYSVTRSNPDGKIGFLRDERRLNVALSRARKGLFIVGDLAFVRALNQGWAWAKVVRYFESNASTCQIEEVAP